MADPQQFISDNIDRFQRELFDFLRIPSVSARSEHTGDTRQAADWLSVRMREAGLETEVLDTARHPVVLGEWRGAGEDAPTVLVYGHYDVQPPDPLDLWTSPPFEPEVRDGRIYARGSADDKGQLFQHVKAVESLLSSTGRLPVNMIVLAEGEEEIGSPNLVPFIERHADRLRCDTVVISDSAMFAPGLPSVLFSLRGLAYFEVTVTGPSGDLHSGSYGGAVGNPATTLARMLATLHDDDGRISIDGFYADVVDWDDDTRSQIRGLPFEEDEFRESVGAPALSGEAGYSTPRAALDPSNLRDQRAALRLHRRGREDGSSGQRDGEGQLPAGTRSGSGESRRALPGARRTSRSSRCDGPDRRASWRQPPWRGQVTGRLVDAATRALERSFGRRPVLTGEGGSIPIVGEFERVLGAPALLVGFALPGANMHAPDEWFPVENFEKGIRALAYLFEDLGNRSATGSTSG